MKIFLLVILAMAIGCQSDRTRGLIARNWNSYGNSFAQTLANVAETHAKLIYFGEKSYTNRGSTLVYTNLTYEVGNYRVELADPMSFEGFVSAFAIVSIDSDISIITISAVEGITPAIFNAMQMLWQGGERPILIFIDDKDMVTKEEMDTVKEKVKEMMTFFGFPLKTLPIYEGQSDKKNKSAAEIKTYLDILTDGYRLKHQVKTPNINNPETPSRFVKTFQYTFDEVYEGQRVIYLNYRKPGLKPYNATGTVVAPTYVAPGMSQDIYIELDEKHPNHAFFDCVLFTEDGNTKISSGFSTIQIA